MTDDELNVLFQAFCRYDVDGTGYISKEDYFSKLIQLKRNLLTDALCELCEISESQEYITYPQFVVLVCTYCLFEPIDMLKFSFAIFDREKKGFIDKDEYKHFLSSLYEYNLNSNLKHMLNYMEELDTGDGQFSFEEVMQVYNIYPAIYYPIFQLQVHTQRYTLGEKYWEIKKHELTDKLHFKRKIEQLKRKKKIKEGEMGLNELVPGADDELIKRMGILYYLMPWKRESERELMKKMAAVDAALEAEQAAIREKENK